MFILQASSSQKHKGKRKNTIQKNYSLVNTGSKLNFLIFFLVSYSIHNFFYMFCSWLLSFWCYKLLYWWFKPLFWMTCENFCISRSVLFANFLSAVGNTVCLQQNITCSSLIYQFYHFHSNYFWHTHLITSVLLLVMLFVIYWLYLKIKTITKIFYEHVVFLNLSLANPESTGGFCLLFVTIAY